MRFEESDSVIPQTAQRKRSVSDSIISFVVAIVYLSIHLVDAQA